MPPTSFCNPLRVLLGILAKSPHRSQREVKGNPCRSTSPYFRGSNTSTLYNRTDVIEIILSRVKSHREDENILDADESWGDWAKGEVCIGNGGNGGAPSSPVVALGSPSIEKRAAMGS